MNLWYDLRLAARTWARTPGLAAVIVLTLALGMGNQGRVAFSIMMAAVGFLLLIACANVANLLLARAVDRSREISVRMSIGASRWRIVRQLLAESVLLALLAGMVGLGLSVIGVRMFTNAFVTPTISYWLQFTMDAQVFAFLAAVCLGTVVLFGLVPAVYTARTSIADVLSEAGRGATGSLRSRRWMGGLVVVQLALTIVLLTSAGLTIRDAIALAQTDVGIETAGVTLMQLNLPALEYPTVERRAIFYSQLGERLASLPGTRATFASAWPHGGTFSGPREFSIERQPEAAAGERPLVSFMVIGPRYFESLGTKPVRGRDFSDADRSGTAIVNERFVVIHFRDRDPIGQRVRIESTATSPASEWLMIVGVVPNIRQHTLDDYGRDFDPIVYVPSASRPLPFTMLLVRSDLSQTMTVNLVRAEVRTLDPDLPLFDVMPLDQELANNRSEARELSTMFTIFATIALVMATVGLYAVTAYAVSQRTREIGIRVALGAPAARIWCLVTRRASVHIAVGLALGMAGALGAGRIFEGLLQDVSGTDAVTFVAVPVLLVIVMLVACLLPARRAARLDPVAALRNE